MPAATTEAFVKRILLQFAVGDHAASRIFLLRVQCPRALSRSFACFLFFLPLLSRWRCRFSGRAEALWVRSSESEERRRELLNPFPPPPLIIIQAKMPSSVRDLQPRSILLLIQVLG